MKRVRTLGLMLMAVFAMSAIAASAASAVVFEPNETAVKATSKNAKFIAPNKLSVECKSTVAEGKTGVASNKIAATAVNSFKECSAFGVAATVTETCGAEKGSTVANSTTSVSVIIAAGCKVVVKTSTCSMTAEGKQELKGTWTNGNGTTTNSKFELKEAPVAVTSTGGICGASGTGGESGTFTVEPVSLKIK
jgi:hypothetical protein